MNNVSLVGRLTREIELKRTENNYFYVNFTIAVNRFSKGEKSADFINCVAWNKTAELLNDYVKKGDRLAVVGNIKVESYEKNDTRVYTTKILVDKITLLSNKEEKVDNYVDDV